MSTRTERQLAAATNMQLLDEIVPPDTCDERARLIRAEILRRLYRIERSELRQKAQQEQQQ